MARTASDSGMAAGPNRRRRFVAPADQPEVVQGDAPVVDTAPKDSEPSQSDSGDNTKTKAKATKSAKAAPAPTSEPATSTDAETDFV